MKVPRSNWLARLLVLFAVLSLYLSLTDHLRTAETPPSFKWVTSARSSTSTMIAADCVVDEFGNSYITGQAGGTSTFFFGTNAAEGANLFVGKCDPLGNVLWLLRDGPDVGGLAWRIGLDDSRNLFVFGQFGSFPPSVPFAGTNVSCALAIGKYSNDGVGLWAAPIARRITNNPNAYAAGMAVHPGLGVYCTAVFHGTVAFGNTNLTGRTDSSPYDDYALLRLTPEGEIAWVRQIRGSGAALQMSQLAVDPQGNILIAGSFVDSVSFGNTNLTVPSGYLSFLAKYSPQGDLLRVTEIGRGPYLGAWNVALDNSGNYYVSMFFREQATFGVHTFTNRAGAYYNAFLKCNPAGELLWVRQTSEGNRSVVAADPAGSVYAADQTSSNQTHYAKFDPAGNLLWERYGPNHQVNAFHVDSSGGPYLFGMVNSSTADFDGLTTTTIFHPYQEAVLARLSSTIPPHLEIQITGPTLTISWPALADDYHLESTADAPSPTSWAPSPLVVSTSNGKNIATADLPATPLFFRLHRD